MDDYSIKKHFGGCPHDCPDTCAMIYEVADNKLLSVRGNPDHPMTDGVLCVKLKDYEKRHYHPDRLLYPHKRVGKKGKKEFERMTVFKNSAVDVDCCLIHVHLDKSKLQGS